MGFTNAHASPAKLLAPAGLLPGLSARPGYHPLGLRLGDAGCASHRALGWDVLIPIGALQGTYRTSTKMCGNNEKGREPRKHICQAVSS